jgi:carboxyl-terminal processing protease
VTIARWYTPDDRLIHGQGLEPDIVVELTVEDMDAGRDPQLDRAVEYLLGGQ